MPTEQLPSEMLRFIAGQIGAEQTALADYAQRDETRREHQQELSLRHARGGCARHYGDAHRSDPGDAQSTDRLVFQKSGAQTFGSVPGDGPGDLRSSGLSIAVTDEASSYLEKRSRQLHESLAAADTLGAQGQLPDVLIAKIMRVYAAANSRQAPPGIHTELRTNPNSKTAFLTSNARPGLKAVPCLGPRCRRERCPCIEVIASHQPENAPAALACSRRDYTIRCGITRPLRRT